MIEQKQLLKIMFKTKLTNEILTNYSRPNITWKPLSVYKRFKYHTTIPNIDKVFINPNIVSFGWKWKLSDKTKVEEGKINVWLPYSI